MANGGVVDIPPAILPGRQLEDAHVRDGQSARGASERDLDELEVCDEGESLFL